MSLSQPYCIPIAVLMLMVQAHGFSLLIKDMLSEFAAVAKTSDTTIKISNFSGNHAWFRQLLHEFQKQVYGHTSELVAQVSHSAASFKLMHHQAHCVWLMQVETRFGTKVMVTKSVLSSAEALQKTVRDKRYTDKAAGVEFGQVCIVAGSANCLKAEP